MKSTVSNRTLNDAGSVEEGLISAYEKTKSLASLIRKTAPLYREFDVTSPFFNWINYVARSVGTSITTILVPLLLVISNTFINNLLS